MKSPPDLEKKGLTLFPVLCGLTIAYFVLRLIFYATSISPDVPPDEVTHFAKSQLFSQTLFLPQDTPSSYALGLVAGIPYLYFLIMGKFLSLNIFPMSDLVFLRLANCALSLATVLVGYKWLRLSTDNKPCLVLYLVAITNTAMFTFLGASVSYDNLVNLLSIVAVYYLHLFLAKERPGDFLCFFLALMVGSLTKQTYLPLIPPLLAILLARGRHSLVKMWQQWPGQPKKARWRLVLPAAATLLLLALNLQLYAGNLIKYHRLIPSSTQILSDKQAMEYRIFARGKIFQQYRNGKITFDEALSMADHIKHLRDREDTINLLKIAREQKENPTPLLNRFQYFREWLIIMQGTTFGILGHHSLIKYYDWAIIFNIISVVCFLALLLRWRPGQARGRFTDAILLVLFYGVILSQYVCYSNYMGSGVLDLSLQGRYIFPVIIPMFAGSAYYLTMHWPRPFQYYAAATLGLIFIVSDFPFFLHSATPIWFR